MAARRTAATFEMLLLSMLANGDPFSGYEFSSKLAAPIPLMWPVKHSQIYPALAALEKRGDISGQWIAQRGRPNKKAYVISDEGKERLLAWLLEPRSSLTHDEVQLIAYNLDLVGRETVFRALGIYRAQSVEAKRQLEERWLKGAEQEWAERSSDDRLTGIRSVYEYGLAMNDAQIVWCDEGLARAGYAIAQSL